MAERTYIQWTDHTFNIAWGCSRVSPGCENCYAEAVARRHGANVWGPGTERRVFGEEYWREPRRWNRQAEREGRRRRILCASMCDVFEDHPTIDAEREKLWPLVRATPWLDWQFLTKRPERIAERLPRDWLDGWPNVWMMTSAEDQATAEERLPHLLRVPAAVHGLVFEPALGPLDFAPWLGPPPARVARARLDWVVVGGESGPAARPFDINWARSVIRQCRAAHAACFVAQIGTRPTVPALVASERLVDELEHSYLRQQLGQLRDRKGASMSEWPEDLRVRELPAGLRG